ncbi:hypothetical protein SEA_PHINKBODEN_5 [Gordonia Phage PhinkBoden]|nr:hypothetical protein SEA_PHINKBODEN_5 [Gordonia Phage PhinkBoden]
MKLWVDDERPPPEGWVWAKDSATAISALGTANVSHLSLDHDLGTRPDGAVDDTRAVVNWICEMRGLYGDDYWPAVVYVHTANPVGREWLEGMVNRYGPGVSRW